MSARRIARSIVCHASYSLVFERDLGSGRELMRRKEIKAGIHQGIARLRFTGKGDCYHENIPATC